MKGRGGFSLVELMVVLVVLGVLATLAYPSYAGYITKTRRIEAQFALMDALQQEQAYYSQHNSYAAFSASGPEPGFRWWVGGMAATSAYELDAHACPGQAIGECVELRATPGTARVDARFRDPECGTLTFTSTGERGASGTSGRCWP
jgi:type IV pilus assembly protein PilE